MANLNKVPQKDIDEQLISKEEPKKVVPVESTDSEYTLNIVRDYYGQIDPFYLSEKDPHYAYRFLNRNEVNLSLKTSNLLLQQGGWQICPKEHLLRLGIKEKELSPEGFLIRGDTILAFMPMELYREKEEYKRDKAQAPMNRVNRLLKEGDKHTGGQELHQTMKGIQTQEQLGM